MTKISTNEDILIAESSLIINNTSNFEINHYFKLLQLPESEYFLHFILDALSWSLHYYTSWKGVVLLSHRTKSWLPKSWNTLTFVCLWSFSSWLLAILLTWRPLFEASGAGTDSARLCVYCGWYGEILYMERPHDDIVVMIVTSGVVWAHRRLHQVMTRETTWMRNTA